MSCTVAESGLGRLGRRKFATRQCEKAWWISAMQTPTSPYHSVIDSMLLGKGRCMHMLLRLPLQGLLGSNAPTCIRKAWKCSNQVEGGNGNEVSEYHKPLSYHWRSYSPSLQAHSLLIPGISHFPYEFPFLTVSTCHCRSTVPRGDGRHATVGSSQRTSKVDTQKHKPQP